MIGYELLTPADVIFQERQRREKEEAVLAEKQAEEDEDEATKETTGAKGKKAKGRGGAGGGRRRRRRRLTGVSRQRKALNEKERQRHHHVARAFDGLKDTLPFTSDEVARYDILRMAAKYIAHLTLKLHRHDSGRSAQTHRHDHFGQPSPGGSSYYDSATSPAASTSGYSYTSWSSSSSTGLGSPAGSSAGEDSGLVLDDTIVAKIQSCLDGCDLDSIATSPDAGAEEDNSDSSESRGAVNEGLIAGIDAANPLRPLPSAQCGVRQVINDAGGGNNDPQTTTVIHTSSSHGDSGDEMSSAVGVDSASAEQTFLGLLEHVDFDSCVPNPRPYSAVSAMLPTCAAPACLQSTAFTDTVITDEYINPNSSDMIGDELREMSPSDEFWDNAQPLDADGEEEKKDFSSLEEKQKELCHTFLSAWDEYVIVDSEEGMVI